MKTGKSMVLALSKQEVKEITADAVKNVYLLPSKEEYQQLSAEKAQRTLAVIFEDPELVAQIRVNTTLTVENAPYLGMVEKIANDGGLVDAAAANKLVSLLGDILDPDKLADSPLTDLGLKNLVAAATGDISDAFLGYAQKKYANFGMGDFTDFDVSVGATFFDKVDQSEVPPIQVNQQALQLYG